MLSAGNAHQLHELWCFFTGCSGSILRGLLELQRYFSF
jgi:hypothetical protein